MNRVWLQEFGKAMLLLRQRKKKGLPSIYRLEWLLESTNLDSPHRYYFVRKAHSFVSFSLRTQRQIVDGIISYLCRVKNDHGVRGKASQRFCPISIILPVVESVLHPTMPVILPKVRAETGCICLFVLRCFVSTIDVEFHCRLAGKISASQPVFPKTLSRERHYHF